MFSLTSAIFFGLLDLIVSAFLIGIGIIILAFISFIVTGMIKAMFFASKPKKPRE